MPHSSPAAQSSRYPGDAGADEEGQGELKAAAAKAQANSAEASSALTDKTEAASTLNLELEQLRCLTGGEAQNQQGSPATTRPGQDPSGVVSRGWMLHGMKAVPTLAEGSGAAHNKTKAELQKQRSILTQCRKDRDCMDGQSGKADDHVAQHEKQLTLPKPVTIKDEAKMAVEHANGLAERSARTSPGLSACAGTLTRMLI
ncbi:hypothetical protein WJX79_006539 [Trebouxia sp. C0005]